MPTYTYKCEKCERIFEVFHTMSENMDTCEKCDSPVKRVLSKPTRLKKNKNFGTPKVGNIVKQYIKDVTEEIKQEKKRITTQEHETK